MVRRAQCSLASPRDTLRCYQGVAPRWVWDMRPAAGCCSDARRKQVQGTTATTQGRRKHTPPQGVGGGGRRDFGCNDVKCCQFVCGDDAWIDEPDRVQSDPYPEFTTRLARSRYRHASACAITGCIANNTVVKRDNHYVPHSNLKR